MSKAQRPSDYSKNWLLASLPGECRKFLSNLEIVEFLQGQILYEQGAIINYVYFPRDAAVSLLSIARDGSAVEVGLIGYEGMVGFPIVLGEERTPFRAMVQIPGGAMRMKADGFREELKCSNKLFRLLLLYTNALIVQLSQSALCNRFHNVEERLCRWLLASQDRANTDTLRYTQELLAHILGADRSDVNAAAKSLQQKGLIRYSRGQINITDRRGLEEASCECYRIVRDVFNKFLEK
jgi:CRP-like cAMP-binding protein